MVTLTAPGNQHAATAVATVHSPLTTAVGPGVLAIDMTAPRKLGKRRKVGKARKIANLCGDLRLSERRAVVSIVHVSESHAVITN